MSVLQGFCGPAYESQSKNAAAEVCMNWYVEQMEAGTPKVPQTLYPCPGFSEFLSVPQSPTRGVFAQDGRAFLLVGYAFYEFFANGSTTLLGSVDIDSNPATISSSGDAGNELFITSGGKGYIFDLVTSAFTEVLSSGATMGDYLDGFFLSLDTSISTVRISKQFDGLTWDPTDIFLRTAGSDKWQSMKVVHQEIWLLGSRTGEVWINSGAFPVPFTPYPGAKLETGTASPFSGSRLSNTLVWLGENEQGSGVVWRSNGFIPTQISNHAIETAIQRYAATSTIADAQSFAYQDQGHEFYVLSFPTAEATWVYDGRNGQWHQRSYWDPATSTEKVYRPHTHTNIFGKHLVGDRESGSVYVMDVALGTEVDGLGIRRRRCSPHVASELKKITCPAFQVEVDPGTPPQTGQGSDPKLMMRLSRNGGKTYGNEHWRSIGKIGEFKNRAIWRRLGDYRDGVYEVVCSEPLPVRLIQAFFPDGLGLGKA